MHKLFESLFSCYKIFSNQKTPASFKTGTARKKQSRKSWLLF
jgi:hypothetical protein